MAWPFTGITSPTLDSGFVAVPAQAAIVPGTSSLATQLWMLGMMFTNGGAQQAFVTVLDGSGAKVIDSALLVANDTPPPYAWEFMPVVGLQWFATGPGAASVTGKAWGYL